VSKGSKKKQLEFFRITIEDDSDRTAAEVMGEGATPQDTRGEQIDKKLDALETVASILAARVRSLTENMPAAFEQKLD
jgi:hypothetical protein